MKITIAPYNPEWPIQFQAIKTELESILEEFNPRIEHIGSTSVPGLAAKPVIDILVGIDGEHLFDKVVETMKDQHRYVYYEVYNSGMPDRRLYVRLKDTENPSRFPRLFREGDFIPHEEMNHARIAHVHIWPHLGPQWQRHIAFREYLKAHPKVRAEYERIKKGLSTREWVDGNEYNMGKDAFIKREEARALEWYKTD